ncbi:MAG: hypothetical protein R2771_07265 [Saprospiraceae bacterium]
MMIFPILYLSIFTLQNIYGCDSIVNLHLEYSEIDTFSTVSRTQAVIAVGVKR